MGKLNYVRIVGVVMVLALVGACAPRQKPPVTNNAPAPEATTASAAPAPKPEPPPPPPIKVEDSAPVAPRLEEDPIGGRGIDDINKNSPLRPAFFVVDSSDLDDTARTVVGENANLLKKYGSWVITIEGHADERGTAEYNLALGEKRALSVKTYLVSLGIPPDRLKTISYGKEFPFDPSHDESAWSKNRRAHFVLTAK
jgi:peptidoglycan-associated lipoprotein